MNEGINIVKYEGTVLNGTGKAGKLRCDPDGYYDVILGGFNVRNTREALWPWDTSAQFFQPGSTLHKRVNAMQLYGEWGHPDKQPGQSEKEFLTRVLNVKEDNVSHHIKEYTIEESYKFPGENGGPAVIIYGRVKPFGPRGEILAESLESETQNTAFSIRTLTRDQFDRMQRPIKRIVAMVTWDAVLSPGIAFATKANSPSLESDIVELCSADDVIKYYNEIKRSSVSFESGFIEEQFKSLISELRTTHVDKRTGLILPASALW